MTVDSQDSCECFDTALVSLLGMNDILREDLSALLDAYKDDQSNQVLRRSFVRASWAYVEAITRALKFMTSILIDAGGCDVEPQEIKFLKQRKTETLTNIKETIRLVAKAFKVSERNVGGGTGWCHVVSNIKVRDRLVHPKSVESLQVVDSEWEAHKRSFVWLVETFDSLLTDISDQYSQGRGCTSSATSN
ncbi:hypothetical protein [Pseudomonas fluorescens]|uniref:hypothetical protein n=1 Tax=Pseudomonas fluorescens TaxID=294 RepID=UPI0017837861|nr:hypothetical protein [Pseudomonas fluorescens]